MIFYVFTCVNRRDSFRNSLTIHTPLRHGHKHRLCSVFRKRFLCMATEHLLGEHADAPLSDLILSLAELRFPHTHRYVHIYTDGACMLKGLHIDKGMRFLPVIKEVQ